jgi:Cu(I)/Ag(I) efflux system protein CusF
MKRTTLTLAALGLTAALAACGQETETEAPAAAPAASAASDSAAMGGMAANTGQTVQGTGTVTAVDSAAGTVTIDHAPIPEAGWPAMVMAFEAPPEVAQQAQVGDKVAFDLKLEGGGGEITAIQKQ